MRVQNEHARLSERVRGRMIGPDLHIVVVYALIVYAQKSKLAVYTIDLVSGGMYCHKLTIRAVYRLANSVAVSSIAIAGLVWLLTACLYKKYAHIKSEILETTKVSCRGTAGARSIQPPDVVRTWRRACP